MGDNGAGAAAAMFRQQSNIPEDAVATTSPQQLGSAAVANTVSPHSSVGELELKLRELGARDERLGRMIGEVAAVTAHMEPEPEPEPEAETETETVSEQDRAFVLEQQQVKEDRERRDKARREAMEPVLEPLTLEPLEAAAGGRTEQT
jgi:hypothetical protein